MRTVKRCSIIYFHFRDIDPGEFLVVMSMHECEFSEALVFQTTDDVSFSMRFK